jgi:putative spermidine/putrescine transport system permease protein
MAASRARPWLLMAPSIILVAGLFILPVAWFIIRALFIDSPPAALPGLVVEVLTSRVTIIAMVTTNWISLVVTLAVLVLAYPIAYFMTTASPLRFFLVVFCVMVPYFTSIIVRTYSLMVLLGGKGIINEALMAAGVISAPLPLLYSKFSVVVGMAYVLLPYMVLTLFTAMKAIDPGLVRAGLALGGGRFYVFRRIYLPLSGPAILSGSLIVFILSIGFFITPSLLVGPSDVLVAMLIERTVEITLDWQQSAVMSLLLLAVTMVLYLVYVRVTDMRRLMEG